MLTHRVSQHLARINRDAGRAELKAVRGLPEETQAPVEPQSRKETCSPSGYYSDEEGASSDYGPMSDFNEEDYESGNYSDDLPDFYEVEGLPRVYRKEPQSDSIRKPPEKRPKSDFWKVKAQSFYKKDWGFPLDLKFSEKAIRDISHKEKFTRMYRQVPNGEDRVFPTRTSLQAHNVRCNLHQMYDRFYTNIWYNKELYSDSLFNFMFKTLRAICPKSFSTNPIFDRKVRQLWALRRQCRGWARSPDRFDPSTKLW